VVRCSWWVSWTKGFEPFTQFLSCNSSELLYRTSDGIQQSDDVTWLNRKDFRLSLKVSRKLGTSRVSAVQPVEFATSNQGELVAWKSFLTGLRVSFPLQNLWGSVVVLTCKLSRSILP
jgi:hypothetical protein